MFIGWDFSAYVLNGRYFLHGGDYMEVLRPPLVLFILGIFLFFGSFGEYLYIIFVSILFLYSSIKLSDYFYEKHWHKYPIKRNDARFLFFLICCNPFLIYFGILEGSELLGLCFLELAIVLFFRNKSFGHYIALAVLTRYDYMILIPLIFINWDYKKILKNLFLFIIILSPWLIYNYFTWGNYFTSIVESYNNNILSRMSIGLPFNYLDILFVCNFLIPFAIGGLFYSFSRILKKQENFLYTFIFIIIAAFVIFDYSNIPFKNKRYLFLLILPAAYFSMIFFLELTKKFSKKKIFFLVFILFLITSAGVGFFEYNHRFSDDMYKSAANEIFRQNFSGCLIRSNHWVPVNYYTGNVYSLWMNPKEATYNNELVLIFNDYKDFSLENFSVITYNKDFVIFSKIGITSQNCKKRMGYNNPDTNSICGVISERFKIFGEDFVKKVCLLFNKY